MPHLVLLFHQHLVAVTFWATAIFKPENKHGMFEFASEIYFLYSLSMIYLRVFGFE